MSTSMGDMTRTQIFNVTEDGLEIKTHGIVIIRSTGYIEQK